METSPLLVAKQTINIFISVADLEILKGATPQNEGSIPEIAKNFSHLGLKSEF
jgi:hypothetical protein